MKKLLDSTLKSVKSATAFLPATMTEKIMKKDGEQVPEPEHRLSTIIMICLAFVIGVLGGLGSILFRAIIAFFHNLFFYGNFAAGYERNAHMEPSVWGVLVIFVPVVGAFIVTWITKTLAPEARGHGVPEVLNAIYYREGKIRPVVVVAKALASAISIGSGGSVGREGPIIQMGSAIGSALGQVVKMPVRQRITLIAAGAAAGIAATFNAPIGGLAFAIELLLVSISARTVTLVAIATVTSTYIGRLYDGLAPSFDVPSLAVFENHLLRFYSLLFCLPLGIMTGLIAAIFIKSIYASEDLFNKTFKNDYIRHMTGMLLVGITLYLFMMHSGHYYVGGVGYSTILDILKGTLNSPALLFLLFAGKLLATNLTLGSGASGGVFSPSLFLGATIGSAFGNGIAFLWPELGIQPAVYAIAGMAAVVGGSTGAVLTAITMTFEQTRDYGIILPIILTVSTAHLVRMKICPESIYTLKLFRRGASVPQGLEAAVTSRGNAGKIMSTDFETVEEDSFVEWHAARHLEPGCRYVAVVSEGKVTGIARDELLCMLRDEDPNIVIVKDFHSVSINARWSEVVRGMGAKETETVLVFKNNKRRAEDLAGVITPRELVKYSRADAELME